MSHDRLSIIGLIPARAGSKRIGGKNIGALAGHPLIAYTIAAARESGVFADVVVSTDSPKIAEIAQHYGASVPFLRPEEFATDLSPDIDWINDLLKKLGDEKKHYDCFSILRPTSPFRQAATIRRAWQQFRQQQDIDSLRAIEKCSQHPGKMWTLEGQKIKPLLKDGPTNPPWHSTPYQKLPEVYVQNASLEMAWTRTVAEHNTIAGEKISPFFTQDHEGFDINNQEDWWLAEYLIAQQKAALPKVSHTSYYQSETVACSKSV